MCHDSIVIPAAAAGQVLIIDRLLAEPDDMFSNVGRTWCRAVWVAAQRGHADVLARLLVDRRYVHAHDSRTTAALHAALQSAAAFGRLGAVQLLLRDVRVDPSRNNCRALRWAVRYGQAAAVELLQADARIAASTACAAGTVPCCGAGGIGASAEGALNRWAT